jgi:hypothetical protein
MSWNDFSTFLYGFVAGVGALTSCFILFHKESPKTVTRKNAGRKKTM